MHTFIKEFFGLKFEYFENDCMANGSVGIGKEWESHITNFIKLWNKTYPIQNLVDVGANFGYHTLLFAREIGGKVYAFEPQLQNFKLLENNVKMNDMNNVIVSNFGCGDVYCDIKMPLIDIVPNTNMGDITPNVAIYNHQFTETKSVLLDEELKLVSPIDVIKIDVQGWEKKVLIGCRNILQTYKPLLIVEFEWFQLKKTNTTCKELFDFIRNQNYYIFYLEYNYPSDHVCVHNDKLDDFRAKFHNVIFPHTDNNSINNNIEHGVTEKIVVV